MATVRVVYWQDIPAVVQATDEVETVRLELSPRFQLLIDAAAMRLGLTSADAYLEEWRKGDAEVRPGAAREVAQAVVTELESRFAEFQARGLGG